MTDITIQNRNLKLAASVYGPASCDPVLFLHGITNSRDTWLEMVETLRDRYRIWTLDFRGHGHSDRAQSYELHDYVSDAQAALSAIGRPAILVGHSLGGCVAGILAQSGQLNVRAAFLEDPPWYLGDKKEWDRSLVSKTFPLIMSAQASLQGKNASLEEYVSLLSNAPSPMGGTARDHITERHLFSHASGLQRQDPRCWGDENEQRPKQRLGVIDVTKPFRCATKVLRGEERLGAVLFEDHQRLLMQTNPNTEVVLYPGCGHLMHQNKSFEGRYREPRAFSYCFMIDVIRTDEIAFRQDQASQAS